MNLDLLIRGALLADGTGSPLRPADVGVREGRVVLLPPRADLVRRAAAQTVEAEGLVVAPGFIDVHTHSDAVTLLGPDAWELAVAPVRMGVTVEICGNCGSGLFPALPERIPEMRGSSRAGFGGDVPIFRDFSGFAAAHGSAPRSNHLASLVGHGTLRAGVVGYDERAASPYELEVMCSLLDEALAQGAAGLSTGLIYTPGTYGGTDEVVALAKVAARHGKPYVTHLRDEMARVEEALEEAVEIARRSGAALHVSHHKTAGKHAWGRTERTLARIASLRASGMDVTCDVYPYTEASTSLSAMLPPWANSGGTQALLGRLRSVSERDRMREAIRDGVPGWENTVGNGGWDRISVACAVRNPSVEGRTIASLGGDPVDAAAELLLAEDGEVTIISHSMREDDVRRVLASDFSMIGSDGVPKPGHPHPRLAGTFPRVLGRYVREQSLISLETAVHKMTGMAAARFGLTDRGVLRDGAHADLVLFDPGTIADGATYGEPLLPPVGLHTVVVAGEIAVQHGTVTTARPGTVVTP
ncbi:N-acyl-D-amino-acid deacylase family protein [Nonomuraea sediminis]|uniref:N-acyl-D-amino-acid deacylase family protein n=1 Tax=Nonomuraea sediminis TaxID=2835864 RepID=UPI001BDDAF67|nr:D-aminoacylase [Nonomuraea sediminis]